MAKTEPEKKPRWYKLIWQAYKVTAPHDKFLLPIMIGEFVGIIGIAVVVGILMGSTAAIVYTSVFGFLTAVLVMLFTLTKRFEKNAFARMEGQIGGSLSVAQSIRSGWSFADDPVSIDPRGKSVVFQGIGRGGVLLLAEGGNAAKKQVDATRRRVSKLIPGVPINAIYVGTGEGQVPLKDLSKKIRRTKKVLSKGERDAVTARLRAIGGQKLAVPKGVDPMRARPNRKGTR
ncbi:DUF4191 domain-containing protein [Demequina aurantiaca]|uniref:DUF4191 domain-containing protein n=1 Tax=Demequina aurantiaca TaxID=676200 RepID=UPI0007802B79|nr:DUF4191 domain-containing protein [Demequina aurantiaca]